MTEYKFNIGDRLRVISQLLAPPGVNKWYKDNLLVVFRFFNGVNNIYVVKADDDISLCVLEKDAELQKRGDRNMQEASEVDSRRLDEGTYQRLRRLGLLGGDVRSYNVGASDYSQHVIQPWSIWQDYGLNPWDADIVKRILRTKQGESRRLDYEKIIHVCEERIRQIELETNKDQKS